MEEGIEVTEKYNLERGSRERIQASSTELPSTEFVKIEKNLASLGFFTPSSKRTRNAKAKSVTLTAMVDGKRVETKATIAPTALFGLPITADQDKWLALHKILSDIQARDGVVTNPVSFTSAEILSLLKIYRDSGKNYQDVSEWLDVMVSTTIISEGAVYAGDKRFFGKERFHVFDQAVSFGKELPDGKIADKNYVWLSRWQLQNINDHHQLPIDLDAYRQLRNFIAKALVPHLQVWLYATRRDGVFEKRYDELCEILSIRRWDYPSKIREKLGPSLDELAERGYLSDWGIERTTDEKHYKILFYHGEKFHRDRQARLNRKSTLGLEDRSSKSNGVKDGSSQHQRVKQQQREDAALTRRAVDPQLIAEFTKRGVTEKRAIELLSNLKPGQDVVAQLEHTDHIVQNPANQVRNPAGFYIRLIETNTPVPDGFETRAKRLAREDRERKERERRQVEDAREQLEWEYENNCATELDHYVDAHAEEFAILAAAKFKKGREQSMFMTESVARIEAREEMRKNLAFPTFEEFLEQKKQGTVFSLKPVAVSPAAAPEPAVAEAQVMATPEPVAEPPSRRALLLIPEPTASGPIMIHLASDPPPPPTEIDGNAAANFA